MATIDIILSTGQLWMAPVDEALPDETTVAAGADWAGNWENMGDTLGPISFSVDTQTFELMTDQKLSPVKQVRTGLAAKFKTTLAEMTGANLAAVLDGTKTSTAAGASQKAWDLITVLAENAQMSTYAVGIEATRLDDDNVALPVRIFFERATFKTTGDIAFTSKAGAGIPIEVTALVPASGFVFQVHNVTAPATS